MGRGGFSVMMGFVALLPGLAFAQTADGTYPGLLACDAAPGAPALRERFSLEIGASQARYRLSAAGATETGTGRVASGTLTLTGRGTGRLSYESRYVGQIDGRSGFLSGTQTGRAGGNAFSRRCQMIVGGG